MTFRDEAARLITFQYNWEYWAVPIVIVFLLGVWLWLVLRHHKG